MSKPIAVYAALTLALTSSAFAYTYTCQEGHFQIDVPEGWEVDKSIEVEPEGVLTFRYVSGKYNASITIQWGLKPDGYVLKKYDDFNDPNSEAPVIDVKVLKQTELFDMNLDAGVIASIESIACYEAYFINDKRLYLLNSDTNAKLPGLNEVIIKTLNSFHAHD